MKVAIMQPYFLPYLGYFQLVAAVDAFVIYDDIKYTKQSWINRNRILVAGAPSTITLPLAHASDALEIHERQLAADFPVHRARLLRRITAAYQAAPSYDTTLPLLQRCFADPAGDLFPFLLRSLQSVLAHLGLTTPLHVSSSLDVDRHLRAQERVIATCAALGATHYVNPPGGRDLYNTAAFAGAGLRLSFLEPHLPAYRQFDHDFVPALSILDVLMFNPLNEVRSWLAVPATRL